MLAAHILGDFAFQTEWIYLNKGENLEVNLYHSLTYTASFVLLGYYSLWGLGIIFVTHFIEDALKARYKVVKTIWQDQFIHLSVIIAIWGYQV
jgi:hypothetical protein